jgi:hypothetical protein
LRRRAARTTVLLSELDCVMLVYGDAQWIESVGSKGDSVDAAIASVPRQPGLRRHAALVGAFVSASELVQGLSDAVLDIKGVDERSPLSDAGTDLLMSLARALDASWRSGFAAGSALPRCGSWKDIRSSSALTVRRAEGYAFYALYPESYLEAAYRCGLGPRTCVIGIRSIGVGLAALVAAALEAPPPVSVRPVGAPFRREIKIGPALAAALTADLERPFAIVDEGPGLSGSSFGAVADWLEERGVGRERIHFFPGHDGPLGPQASLEHRRRWQDAARHVVSLDDWLLRSPSPARRLETWLRDLIGPLDGPLEDLSGGAWRSRHYDQERAWPAADVRQERRKFLARASGTEWLVKFAGLGQEGEEKLRTARRLAEAGFATAVAGYRHGFLVERWLAAARPLDRASFERSALVAGIGSYLGFRARHCPARRPGASPKELRTMAVHNTAEALGGAAAGALAEQLSIDGLDRLAHAVDTDNRMLPHEWLVHEGRLLKTDGVDHSAAHDLVGCQDIAWDIAGARIEFELLDEEASRLCAIVSHVSGRPVERDLLAFFEPCYLAFRLGACTMAAAAAHEQEKKRLLAAAGRYSAALAGRNGAPREFILKPPWV